MKTLHAVLPFVALVLTGCDKSDSSTNSNTGSTGPITDQLRSALLDIQTGVSPDTHGWMHTLVR